MPERKRFFFNWGLPLWVILLRCRKWKWKRKQLFSVQTTQLRLVPCRQWWPRASVPTARDPSQPLRRGRCTNSRSPERKLKTASAKKWTLVQFFVAQVHVYVFQCGGCGTKFASKRNLAKHSHKCSSKPGSAVCTIVVFKYHIFSLNWFWKFIKAKYSHKYSSKSGSTKCTNHLV